MKAEFKFEIISSHDVKHGDTIRDGYNFPIAFPNSREGDGEFVTVDKDDASYLRSIPKKQIERVLFPKWYKGEVVNYQAQI